eukprot:TRINITY_DN4524_c0_g1_i2.p1 TRINITY_DN4524_c0_g1~~TRINITY_DN4524_c0_g1_i2.p1  ORF type:complete len:275 (+),score=93.91 TRINITY_DN4524_c0_g1_i2:31-825(+)
MGRVSRKKKLKQVSDNPLDPNVEADKSELPPPLQSIGDKEKLPASFRRMLALQKSIKKKKPKRKKPTEMEVLKRRTDIDIRENETFEEFSRRVHDETTNELRLVDQRFAKYRKRERKQREEKKKERLALQKQKQKEKEGEEKDKNDNDIDNQQKGQKSKKANQEDGDTPKKKQKGEPQQEVNKTNNRNKKGKDFDDFQDPVKFGDVVQEPPRFQSLKKKEQQKNQTKAQNTPFKQQLREQAVAQYRELKKKRRLQEKLCSVKDR